jgi:hypothetical protein
MRLVMHAWICFLSGAFPLRMCATTIQIRLAISPITWFFRCVRCLSRALLDRLFHLLCASLRANTILCPKLDCSFTC